MLLFVALTGVPALGVDPGLRRVCDHDDGREDGGTAIPNGRLRVEGDPGRKCDSRRRLRGLSCFISLKALPALSFVLGLGLVCRSRRRRRPWRSAPASRLGEATGLRLMLVNGTQTVLPSAFGALGVR